MQQLSQIPVLGFGTYRLKGEIAFKSTLIALKNGYKHIDTANLYKNEDQIGKAIKESGVLRKDLWITTKVQVKDISLGKNAIYNSIMNSFNQLQTDYLDLVLLHGPTDKIKENWLDLEEIYESLKGKIRYIGVSNYNIDDLEKLKDYKIKPYTNQIEVSPFLNRNELINYCLAKGIIVTAHTSLIKGEKFNDTKLLNLANETGISMSKLLLCWAKQKGLIILPRSSKEEHIKENMECMDIHLDKETMDTLDSFHDGTCTHPKYINL